LWGWTEEKKAVERGDCLIGNPSCYRGEDHGEGSGEGDPYGSAGNNLNKRGGYKIDHSWISRKSDWGGIPRKRGTDPFFQTGGREHFKMGGTVEQAKS